MAQPEYDYISVENYLAIDQGSTEARYEYFDGEMRMLAGGSVYHSLISNNMSSALHRLLRGSACRVYSSDMRLQLSATRYVYPDVTVSCDKRDQVQGENIHYPSAIVEVLSPSTEVVDRIKKFAYYRECATVQEYVMIDSRKVLVEVYRREQEGWLLQTLGIEDTLLLKSLGVQVAIQDIYEEIDFSASHDPRN
jgi:Uma2 family endonuclease